MTPGTKIKTPTGRAAVLSVVVSIVAFLLVGCSTVAADAVSGATASIMDPVMSAEIQGSGVLIILAASRNGSTARVADAIAKELGAKVFAPWQVNPDELDDYALVGFGSGIFDQMHHKSLFDIADRLPRLQGRKVFIFSTSGISRQFALKNKIDDPHASLRDKLLAKGYTVVGEFNCEGFNDNSFLKLFGGMNKGRPNTDDLRRATGFAEGL